jgi:hypothetical protein
MREQYSERFVDETVQHEYRARNDRRRQILWTDRIFCEKGMLR